jgi:hypothetical protein
LNAIEKQAHNWCRYTHELLIELKLNQYWEDKPVTELDPKLWDSMITAAIHARDRDLAFNRIQQSNQSNRVYAKLIHDPTVISFTSPALYLLTENPTPRLRLGCRELTRLRLNSHRLSAETSTWNRQSTSSDDNTESSESICKHCNLNRLEDEYHYLFECTAYTDYRERLYVQLRRFDLNAIELINTEDRILKLQLMLGSGFSKLNQSAQSVIKSYLGDCAIKRQSLEESLINSQNTHRSHRRLRSILIAAG